MGSGPSPLSCGVFLPLPLLQAFPLLVAGCVPLLLSSPAGLFIYSSVRDFPFPLLRHSGHPALFARVFFAVVVYYSVFFPSFPGWGSVCPGGYADLAQGCLWEYCMLLVHLVVRIFPSSLGAGVWRLVSPFNVKWRCYVQVWRSQSFASSRCFFL
jgi:hypothetical protein